MSRRLAIVYEPDERYTRLDYISTQLTNGQRQLIRQEYDIQFFAHQSGLLQKLKNVNPTDLVLLEKVRDYYEVEEKISGLQEFLSCSHIYLFSKVKRGSPPFVTLYPLRSVLRVGSLPEVFWRERYYDIL